MEDAEQFDVWTEDSVIIEDPEMLAAAERAVSHVDAADLYQQFDETWVEVLGPVSLLNVTGSLTAFQITSPLQAAGIPYVWTPFSPEALTGVRPELMNARRFRLFVPAEDAEEARVALGEKWSDTKE